MGDIRRVRIAAVTPTDEGPDRGVALRREATLRKAVDQSDLTNAILFASSFNGKWGDYDPAGLMEEKRRFIRPVGHGVSIKGHLVTCIPRARFQANPGHEGRLGNFYAMVFIPCPNYNKGEKL